MLVAPQLAVDARDSSAGKILGAGRLRPFRRRGRPEARQASRRPPLGAHLRQHAGRHRRLQRRLSAGRLVRRRRAASRSACAASCCSTRSTASSTRSPAGIRTTGRPSSSAPISARRGAQERRARDAPGLARGPDDRQPRRRACSRAASPSSGRAAGTTRSPTATSSRRAWVENPIQDLLARMREYRR